MEVAAAWLPSRFAALGVIGTGLAWSLGALAAHWHDVRAIEQSLLLSFALVAAGGMAMTFATWGGLGAVAWAMARLLRGTPGLGAILAALASATPPLWIAAPALALLLKEQAPIAGTVLLGLIAACTALFACQVAAGLRAAAGLTSTRAWACLGLTGVFCLSFAFLGQ